MLIVKIFKGNVMFKFFLILAGSLISINASTASYACDNSLGEISSSYSVGTYTDSTDVSTPEYHIAELGEDSNRLEHFTNPYETTEQELLTTYCTVNEASNCDIRAFLDSSTSSESLQELIGTYGIDEAIMHSSRTNDTELDYAGMFLRSNDINIVTNLHTDNVELNRLSALRTNISNLFTTSDMIVASSLRENSVNLAPSNISVIERPQTNGGLAPSNVSAIECAQTSGGEETNCLCCSSCICCSIC